jgi:hypothetical protein
MRRRKKIKQSNPNTKVFKLLFIIAGVIFGLTGLLYISREILQIFVTAPSVFASPYLRQNQFIGIEEKLHAKGLALESQQLSPNKSILTIKLQKGPEVILSDEQDIDWQISSLHSIIYKLTIENKQPKQIDFRFGKPIVKY